MDNFLICEQILVADATLENFFGDHPLGIEHLKVSIHENHSLISAELDHRIELMSHTLHDDTPYGIIVDENFSGDDTTCGVLLWEESLADNCSETHRELDSYLALGCGGK